MGHTLSAKSIKANTIVLHLKASALLCEPRRLVSPIVSCYGRKSAWIKSTILEQRRWESMNNRKEPLTVEMILHTYNLADRQGEDFLMAALRD
eukprot:442199-Ditylum_brightwellii.AAC.1